MPQLTYKVFTGDSLAEGSAFALKYRLCKADGELKELYKEYRLAEKLKKEYPESKPWIPKSDGRLIIVALADGKPVGSAMIQTDQLQMYVLYKWRRLGIGSSIYKKAMTLTGKTCPFNVWKGGRQARAFFNAVEKELKK